MFDVFRMIAAFFGFGAQTPSQTPLRSSFRPTFDALEDRTVMTATATRPQAVMAPVTTVQQPAQKMTVNHTVTDQRANIVRRPVAKKQRRRPTFRRITIQPNIPFVVGAWRARVNKIDVQVKVDNGLKAEIVDLRTGAVVKSGHGMIRWIWKGAKPKLVHFAIRFTAPCTPSHTPGVAVRGAWIDIHKTVGTKKVWMAQDLEVQTPLCIITPPQPPPPPRVPVAVKVSSTRPPINPGTNVPVTYGSFGDTPTTDRLGQITLSGTGLSAVSNIRVFRVDGNGNQVGPDLPVTVAYGATITITLDVEIPVQLGIVGFSAGQAQVTHVSAQTVG